MKRIVSLTGAIFVVSASLSFALGRKSTSPRSESAMLSATLSDQERSTEKPSKASAEEEQQVRKMLMDRREAANRHDVKTFCSYFADDADFVNVAGSWWQGKQEIEKNFTELYATMFRNIHFNDSDIAIRFITPDVAVEHFKWEATGIVGPDGSPRPPRQGIGTILAVKRNGNWLVAVGNNNEFTASIARRLSKETQTQKP